MKVVEQFESSSTTQLTQKKVQRWDAVVLITIFMTGNCYCVQEVPTIHDFLKKEFSSQDILDFQFDQYIHFGQSCAMGILIFYASLVGHLSDKFSPGIIILFQSLILTLCQFMIYLSVSLNNFWFLFFGRVGLFVQGSSLLITTNVLTNNLTTQQYKGLSLGIISSCVFAFGLNLLVEPMLVKEYGLSSTTFISFSIALVSFVLSIFTFYIERKVLLQQEAQQFIEIKTEELTYAEDKCKVEIIQEPETLSPKRQGYLEQMKGLNKIYWIFCPLSFLSIIVTTIAEVCGPAIITSLWKYDPTVSAQINSIGQFMGVAIPFLGYAIDKMKKDYELIILDSVIQLIGIISLGFISPFAGFIIFGAGHNIRKSIQSPFLSKIVPKHSFGKAFGLIKSLRDFFGMLVFLYISQSVKETHSYENVIKMMIIFCSLILTLSIILFICGRKQRFQ